MFFWIEITKGINFCENENSRKDAKDYNVNILPIFLGFFRTLDLWCTSLAMYLVKRIMLFTLQ